MKERFAGSLDPAPCYSGLGAGRDFPECLKSPEMVDTHGIDRLEQPSQAAHPPGVIGFGVPLPVIVRVAPQLSRLAEIVRRHSGAGLRPPVRIQGEQVGAGPHIGAVMRDKNRQVADDPDSLLVGATPQLLPLAEEQILTEPVKFDLDSQFPSSLFQRRRLASGDIRRPLGPGTPAVAVLQRHEQGVVIQPERRFAAELPIRLLRRLPAEAGESLLQQLLFYGDYLFVFHLGRTKSCFCLLLRQQSLLHQQLR